VVLADQGDSAEAIEFLDRRRRSFHRAGGIAHQEFDEPAVDSTVGVQFPHRGLNASQEMSSCVRPAGRRERSHGTHAQGHSGCHDERLPAR
jgi:hypothetical protein